MKIAILASVVIAYIFVGQSGVAAQSDQYTIDTDPYDTGGTGSRSVEMKKKYDYDYSSKYRGEIEEDGSVRMRNLDGDRLRGYIDEDGYGRLRDDEGNIYRVRPR